MSNDQRIINKQDVLGILGVSVPNGNAQINSIYVPLVNTTRLIVSGDIYFNGVIRTPLKLTSGVEFPDGTAARPSITFTSDTTTGIYYSPTSVNFTASGVKKMSVGPTSVNFSTQLTTDGGADLVLNPSGSNVDFSGKNLINYAGISQNANRYDVIAPATVTTLDATPAVLYNIPTVINSAYLLSTDVVATNITDGSSIATFTLNSMIKNIAGVITITPPLNVTTSTNVTLDGATIDHLSSGANITVTITGKLATTIKWFGATLVTRQLF